MLGGGVISLAAVLQKTIAQSTTEAELTALRAASQEGTYLLNLLRELGVDISNFKFFSDAMSALSLSSQAMFSSRTKHIATKFYLLRESVENGNVVVNHKFPLGFNSTLGSADEERAQAYVPATPATRTIVQRLVNLGETI